MVKLQISLPATWPSSKSSRCIINRRWPHNAQLRRSEKWKSVPIIWQSLQLIFTSRVIDIDTCCNLITKCKSLQSTLFPPFINHPQQENRQLIISWMFIIIENCLFSVTVAFPPDHGLPRIHSVVRQKLQGSARHAELIKMCRMLHFAKRCKWKENNGHYGRSLTFNPPPNWLTELITTSRSENVEQYWMNI